MKVTFLNKCGKNVLLEIHDNDFFLIRPLEKKTLIVEDLDTVKISVRKEESSFIEKSLFNKKYIVTIKTTYSFCNKESEEILLTIVRETHRITGNMYYDKIILCENNDITKECNNSACDTEHIKSFYNKRYALYNFFVSPFEHLTLLCVSIFVLTVVFAVKINLLFSTIFFIVAYILIWILNNTIGKLSDLFHKRAFGVDNDKKEFHTALTENYINAFYQEEIPQAYNDDIKRDEV